MGREGRDYWDAQLSEYWDSGFTIQEYSELKVLPYESTRRWIRVLQKAHQNGASDLEKLEQIEVKPLPADTRNGCMRPAFFRRFGSVRIDAAMQKFVKIVRLIGEVRADDVAADGEDHGYEINFKRIDRKFHRVHAPGNPRIERRGDRFEEGVQRFHHAEPFQHGIDALRPVALENQSEQRSAGPENNRAPCAGQVSETAVKSEDHDRARAAEPYRAHDRREHVDVVQLGEENRHDQEKRPPRRRSSGAGEADVFSGPDAL